MVFLGSASGLTRQRLRGRAYVQLSRDLYVARGSAVTLRVRTEAALLAMPDAVPCGRTAAALLRLPVDDDGLVHLARGRAAPRSERPGVRVHRTPVEPDEQRVVQGLAVAAGSRAFVDLAAVLGLEALVALGDAVVRRDGAAAVAAAVARRTRRPGLPLARRALSLLDGGADSPAETRLRLRLHAAGFTALRHGTVVRDTWGGWIAAPDLGDPQAKVAVQHDGEVHADGGRRQRHHDVLRDELTRQCGWQVVVTTAVDDRRPRQVVERVTHAYLRAAREHGPQVLPAFLR